MKTSPFLDEIAREAEARGAREMLTAYIGGLMGSGIPKDISKRIDSEQDYARLRGWARAIGRASSFDELRTLLDA